MGKRSSRINVPLADTEKPECILSAEKEKAPQGRGFRRNERMNNSMNGVMITLFASMSQGENHYTRTSVAKIIENLKKHHEIHVKRRWIFYILRDLIENGYIRRKCRYRNNETGLISQIPSLLSFTLKGVVYLVKKYVVGAKKLYKSMVKFAQRKDKRWPSEEFKKDTSYRPATPEEQKRLNDLLASVGVDINKMRDGKSPG